MASNDSVKRAARDAESQSALVSARNSLEKLKDFEYGNTKVEGEFYALGLLTRAEQVAALRAALVQTKARHRRGPGPPDNISTGTHGGNLMYAFRWFSGAYGPIYFKFCLAASWKGVARLVLYSFHWDRPKYRA